MQILLSPLVLVLCILAMAMHFLPLLLPKCYRKIPRCVNICFHIVIYAVFLLRSIPLEEVAFFYLLSLLLYLFAALLEEKCLHAHNGEVEK